MQIMGPPMQYGEEIRIGLRSRGLSCRRFRGNVARLQLFAPTDNLANFLQQLVLPEPPPEWR